MVGVIVSRLVLAAVVVAASTSVRSEPSRLQSLIGDAACTSDSDCATIGVGVRACGGPAAYVAWSRLRTDRAALQAAVQAQAAQHGASDASTSFSTCTAVRDPGAWCDRRASRGAVPNGACRVRGAVGGTRPHASSPVQ
jgi:hypothetical protein